MKPFTIELEPVGWVMIYRVLSDIEVKNQGSSVDQQVVQRFCDGVKKQIEAGLKEQGLRPDARVQIDDKAQKLFLK